MTRATLREWLAEAPYHLGLSSGFFGFFAHAGVLSVLEQEGLLPESISGSSAGALVGGLWAAGLDSARLVSELTSLRREEFWDPAPGLGLLRGRRFRDRLHALVGSARIERTRVPLAVSAFDVGLRGTVVLDQGDLASALHASCAVPLLFQPVRREGRALLDGGILDRPGLAGAPSAARVLHHHLASRSPWRRRGSAAIAPPRAAGLVAFVIDELPRSGPFRLDRGRAALDRAATATRAALDRAVTPELHA